MKLDFVALDRLSIGTSNMRFARRAPDVADLLRGRHWRSLFGDRP